MNKSNINIENVLPELPEGFDKKRIVMPERVLRRKANTLRLNRCDFDCARRKGDGRRGVLRRDSRLAPHGGRAGGEAGVGQSE